MYFERRSFKEKALIIILSMKFARVLIIASIFLYYLVEGCFGATPPPDNARITVVKGGGATFIFNALDKYTNGITLSDWTVVRIVYLDEAPIESTGWSFTVAAVQTEIKMSGGVPAIPLDYMLLRITVDGVPFGEYPLSNAPTTLLSDLDFGDPANASHEVKITYLLGTIPPKIVSSFPSGFYYVDLSFDLLVKP